MISLWYHTPWRPGKVPSGRARGVLVLSIVVAVSVALLPALYASPRTPLAASVAPVRVQTAKASLSSANTTLSVGLAQPPLAADTLIAVIGTKGSTNSVSSISQTGVTWSKVISWGGNGSSSTDIWYASNAGGAATSLTISLSSSLAAVAIVAEYSGLVTSGVVDQVSNTIANNSSATAGTKMVTTTQPNEVWIGSFSTSAPATYSAPGNGFSLVDQTASTLKGSSTNNVGLDYQEAITTTIGSAWTTATLSAATASIGGVVTFKAAPTSYTAAGYRLFANTDTTDVGAPLAASNTPATLAAPGDPFRLRQLLRVGNLGIGSSGQPFKLQFAQRGSDLLCDTGFVGETYRDISPIAGSGPTGPATATDDSGTGSVAWTNPGNATASDGALASATVSTTSASHYLAVTNFGFSLPSDAAIFGIQAIVWASSSPAAVVPASIKIIKGGSMTGTDQVIPGTTVWPFSTGSMSFGRATNTWGVSWTAADINSSGFGVGISAEATTGSATANIDYITLTVSYGRATGVIGYYQNPTPADGAALTANANDPTDGAYAVVTQAYLATSPSFSNSVAAITADQDGEWDFSLYDNGAPSGTTYCFRVVKPSGAPLDSYSVVPQITTASAGPTPTPTPSNDQLLRHGTWFLNGVKQPMTF